MHQADCWQEVIVTVVVTAVLLLRLLALAVPQMRDYALLLGMPGTGKTTTIVHIIKVRRHVWMLL